MAKAIGLTNRQIELIIAMDDEGAPVIDIAAAVGCTGPNITYHLKKLGRPRNNRRPARVTLARRKRIVAAYEDKGFNHAKAERFGYSCADSFMGSAIYHRNFLAQRGVDTR